MKLNNNKTKIILLSVALTIFVAQPTYAWRLFGREFIPSYQASQPEGAGQVYYGTYNYYFLGICYKSEPGERHGNITAEE